MWTCSMRPCSTAVSTALLCSTLRESFLLAEAIADQIAISKYYLQAFGEFMVICEAFALPDLILGEKSITIP